MKLANLERNFFSTLNRYVEPAVRKGVLSSRIAPAGLIVLETTGFKSGTIRSTPLLATRLGPYVLVSTVRGERSFWVKNLIKDSNIRYFIGGKARDSEALVVAPGKEAPAQEDLPLVLRKLVELLTPFTDKGWAFALLRPAA